MPSEQFIGRGQILRLSVLKQLGGYAKFPGSYGCEEKDLCLRIIDAGYEITVLPGVHVWHDYSPDGRNESQYLSGLHNDLAMVLWRAPLPIFATGIDMESASTISSRAKDKLRARIAEGCP